MNEKRKYTIRVELGTFHPESVQVVIDSDKVLVRCEEELQIDEKTTSKRLFGFTLNI